MPLDHALALEVFLTNALENPILLWGLSREKPRMSQKFKSLNHENLVKNSIVLGDLGLGVGDSLGSPGDPA
jgi:hypothetical protein